PAGSEGRIRGDLKLVAGRPSYGRPHERRRRIGGEVAYRRDIDGEAVYIARYGYTAQTVQCLNLPVIYRLVQRRPPRIGSRVHDDGSSHRWVNRIQEQSVLIGTLCCPTQRGLGQGHHVFSRSD